MPDGRSAGAADRRAVAAADAAAERDSRSRLAGDRRRRASAARRRSRRRQLDPTQASWAGAVAAPRASSDPWQPSGAVVVAYGPGVDGDDAIGGDRGAGRLDRLGAEPPARHLRRVRVQRAEIARAAGRAARRAARHVAATRQRRPARRGARDPRARARARAAADRRSRRCRIRRPPRSSARWRRGISSRGGRHEQPALSDSRTRAHRHRRGAARARRRSGLVHHPPVAARRAAGRRRVDARRRHRGAAARAAHLRSRAAGSRSDGDPGRSAARGRARRLVDDRPARAARPRSSAAARVRTRVSVIASAGCRRLRDACGRRRRARGVRRRPARRPCDLGRSALARSRSLVLVGARLQRVVRSRAAPACVRAITPAATSTGSRWTAIRSRCRSPGRRSRRRTARSIPGRLDYPGAPHPRWWQLENHAVDIGGFSPDRSHFATMLLLDVALEHADDWFTFPVPPPATIPTRCRRAACSSRWPA